MPTVGPALTGLMNHPSLEVTSVPSAVSDPGCRPATPFVSLIERDAGHRAIVGDRAAQQRERGIGGNRPGNGEQPADHRRLIARRVDRQRRAGGCARRRLVVDRDGVIGVRRKRQAARAEIDRPAASPQHAAADRKIRADLQPADAIGFAIKGDAADRAIRISHAAGEQRDGGALRDRVGRDRERPDRRRGVDAVHGRGRFHSGVIHRKPIAERIGSCAGRAGRLRQPRDRGGVDHQRIARRACGAVAVDSICGRRRRRDVVGVSPLTAAERNAFSGRVGDGAQRCAREAGGGQCVRVTRCVVDVVERDRVRACVAAEGKRTCDRIQHLCAAAAQIDRVVAAAGVDGERLRHADAGDVNRAGAGSRVKPHGFRGKRERPRAAAQQ